MCDNCCMHLSDIRGMTQSHKEFNKWFKEIKWHKVGCLTYCDECYNKWDEVIAKEDRKDWKEYLIMYGPKK